MKFEDAVKEAIAADEADLLYIDTLTFNHGALSEPIRVACAYESFTAEGEHYQAFPFELAFPPMSEKSGSIMTITLHDADNSIFQAAQSIARTNEPATTVWKQFIHDGQQFTLASQFRVPMDVTNVTRSKQRTDKGIAKVVTMACSHVDFINRTVGHYKYTANDFEGLKQ